MCCAVKLLAAVALLTVAGAAAAQTADLPKGKREAASAWSAEGLQQIEVKGLDTVYARPGMNLAGYDRILLKPISVAFKKGWTMTPLPGSRDRVSPADAQRIRARVSVLAQEEVARELMAGGYKMANEPGEDVLDVQMSIVDLSIAAPDVKNSVHTTTYAISAGEMSLVAQLSDSLSGEVLLRAFDRTTATETTWAHQITGVENEAEGRRAAQQWAKALRRELDLARSAK
jgi:hypothetical protein